MKIVHTEASLGFGGQELRILNEMQGLKAKGHEMLLICPSYSEIYKIAQQRSLSVVDMPINKKTPSVILKMRQWIFEHKPDVINTHSSTDSWVVALSTRFMWQRPKIVRTRHVSVPVSKSFTSYWLYMKASDHIITTGENLRQVLISDNKYQAEKMTSIRTGIDLNYFKPHNKQQARLELGLAENKLIIGIAATLRSWKGHYYLLQAFAQLADKENLQLLIVGDGPRWNELHKETNKLGIEEQVMFVGRKENVALWIQAMDIFCLPSYAGEGVPQALMQAQACGLPIVTTLIGSINEAIVPEKTTLIAEPQDIESLKAALEKLIEQPKLRQEMGDYAANFAHQNFSDSEMLEKMEQIFTQIIA